MNKYLKALAIVTIFSVVWVSASPTQAAPIHGNGLNGLAQAQAKSGKLAGVGALSRRQRDGFEIEIVSTREIFDGTGVEAMVKAWKNGERVGFADGTVEIERFRIFNPPVLVPDPAGSITIERTNYKGVTFSLNYREDYQEALLQVVEHALSVIEIYDDSNIVTGKKGSTVSTFFSEPNVEVNVMDAVTSTFNANDTWANIRSAAGDGSNDAGGTISAVIRSGASSGFEGINRAVIGFVTSSIGSDTVDSGTLSFTCDDAGDNFAHFISVDTNPPASNTSIVDSDFDVAGWSGTKQAADIDLSDLTCDSSAYNDASLVAAGKTTVNTSGNTWFGWRITADLTNTEPSRGNGIDGGPSIIASEAAGTSTDPKLVISHSVAAAAGGGVTIRTIIPF